MRPGKAEDLRALARIVKALDGAKATEETVRLRKLDVQRALNILARATGRLEAR